MENGGGMGWGQAKIDHLSIKPEPRPNRAFKIIWPKRPFGPLKPWPRDPNSGKKSIAKAKRKTHFCEKCENLTEYFALSKIN